jgi:hypothetical protein
VSPRRSTRRPNRASCPISTTLTATVATSHVGLSRPTGLELTPRVGHAARPRKTSPDRTLQSQPHRRAPAQARPESSTQAQHPIRLSSADPARLTCVGRRSSVRTRRFFPAVGETRADAASCRPGRPPGSRDQTGHFCCGGGRGRACVCETAGLDQQAPHDSAACSISHVGARKPFLDR